MKKLLPIFLLVSCSKEINNCPELLFIATTYQNEIIVEQLTTSFGTVCGNELRYYQDIISKQPVKGVMICPPVPQYGRWVLK